MALKPHIIHIVGPTEADHAATAEEVIEACGLARRAIDNAIARSTGYDRRSRRYKERG